VIGIRDQRREIHHSHGSNSDVYNELGELRELSNFVRNEEERFSKLYDLQPESEFDEEDKLDPRPIFRVIKFFKRIENRLDHTKSNEYLSTLKETEFLKGRIKELETIKEDKENLSSINLSKTREHCS
jgi:hypothetical protein